MDIQKLNKILADKPKYRKQQVQAVIFKQLLENWDEATVFPVALRQRLNQEFPLAIKARLSASKKDEVSKALVTLGDGCKIETVLMRHRDGRNTVCVSSQVGCPLGCAFCATGQLGFFRNLDTWEIIQQVLVFARRLKKENQRVTNLVFMGMGEPFLNYDNVIEAIRILNDKEGLAIGARHISISTVGVIEGIEKLTEEKLQLNLAISLHAPTNQIRSRLVPYNKKAPIETVLKAVDGYVAQAKRKVMFEYLMIDGINDSDACARQLAKLMKKPLYFLNLILYNPTGKFNPSPARQVKNFKEILLKAGVQVVQRYRFGTDIKAACGQLAGQEK